MRNEFRGNLVLGALKNKKEEFFYHFWNFEKFFCNF